MLSHDERIGAARSAVDYLTGRSDEEWTRPVPNCPGWTVYNAAVHVGRGSVIWHRTLECAPGDPTAREDLLAIFMFDHLIRRLGSAHSDRSGSGGVGSRRG